MEYPNYYYEDKAQGSNEQKPPKRGIGGYIITAIVFTLVGALLATIIMPSSDMTLSALPSEATPTPRLEAQVPGVEATPAPAATAAPQAGTESAQPEPSATTYDMPKLDGVAPEISDEANPIPDIVEQVSDGVVGIINYVYDSQYGEYVEQGSGSGFVISSDGYILTNQHVVDGADKVSVMFVNGEEYDAAVIGSDSTSDLAALKVELTGLAAMKIGDSDGLRVGEFVITIGDPTGRELAGTTTFGIISATARSINIDGQTNSYIQTDAAVNPGNSGGPLINMNGEVIGVTSAKTVTASYDEYGNAISAEGLGFALPINEVMEVAEQLITEGGILRPGIGISVIEWNESYAREYNTVTGVLVYSVTLDGPGDKAGIEANDIIVEVNGEAVPSQTEFVEIVRSMKVGDTLELKIWRGGEYFTTDLQLADLNSLGTELKGDTANFSFFE